MPLIMTSKRSSENSNQQSKRTRASNISVKCEDEDDSTESETQQYTNIQVQPEVGIIESIHLKNFMCHSYLSFTFGSNVNFICGRNGSGKSAILTAAIIGLGGKALATNRASSVKDFIMNGKNSAEIVITLRNIGIDAFKPELYGNSIIVQRLLSADGSSKYKLKSHNNKTVSSKKEELTHLLDHFNIQVDNPLCILNQDMSRKFLQTSSPKTLYQLFLKATQLDQMKQDYESINMQKSDVKKILDHNIKEIPEIKKEEKYWKTRLDHHTSLDRLRDKVNMLYSELAWAQVKGLEEECSDEMKKLKDLNSQTPKFTQKVDEYTEKFTVSQMKHVEVDNKLKTLNNELNEIKPKYEELKKSVEKKKDLQRNATHECKRIESSIKAVDRDRSMLQRQIEEIKKGESKDYSNEKQERQERILTMETMLLDLKTRYETMELHCQQLRSAVTQYNEQIKSAKQEENNIRNDIQSITNKMKNLESSRSNYMKRFGPWVPDALQLINQAFNNKEFRQKPRGPIGAFVKLHDTKWNLAVENCLKPLLYAFCCDNYADQKVLENLLGRVIRQYNARMPTIITSRFNSMMYDVSAHCVQSHKYSSILNMLKINDPIITNVLIDQRRIESILLIENAAEARYIMAHEVPLNCKEAFTCTGDQLYPTPRFRVYSSQNDRAHLLQESLDDAIRNLQHEHVNLQRQERDINAQLTNLNQEYNSNLGELRKNDSNLVRLQQQIREENSKLNELKSIVDPEPIYTASLEEDLQEMSNQRKILVQQSVLALAKYQACKADTVETFKEYQAIDEKMTSLMTEELEPLKEELADINHDKELMKSNMQHYVTKLNSHKEHLEKLTQSYDKKKEEVDKYFQVTEEKFGPCLERIRSADRIQTEIQQTEKVLLVAQETHGSKEEIIRKHMQIKNRKEKIFHIIDDLEKFIKNLDIMMARRQKYFNVLCNYTGIKVRSYFAASLKLRKFDGDIHFSHSAETLKITFHSKEDNCEANTSVRGLSGGERSFSTVSLILALWDATESPFRMMDEFDVFMDMVNRRFSMTMLIDSARAKQSNQFIFLTPLNISFIDLCPTIKIFRMRDPERNQTILPFHPIQNENESGNED